MPTELTVNNVKALKRATKAYFVWNSQATGLGVKITPPMAGRERGGGAVAKQWRDEVKAGRDPKAVEAERLEAERLTPFTHSGGKLWASLGVKKRLERHMLNILRLNILRAMARKRGDGPDAVRLERWVNNDVRRVGRSHLAALGVEDHIAGASCAARP